MISINKEVWNDIVQHARETYPDECCGALLGDVDSDRKTVRHSMRLDNVHSGPRRTRYELRPEDIMKADGEARNRSMELIGIYHSHPDHDAYFSETDLKNSCPWYSFVVVSVKNGNFDHARSWLPNEEQTHAQQEELIY